jgi:hypothetical protein
MNEPISFWDDVNTWAARTGALSAFFAALYAIYRTAKATILKIINISNKINAISEQLTSNGGSSLVDAVARIESRQVRNEQRERAFLHHHSTPMFELDEKLALRWANSSFLKLVQFDSDDAAGYGWHNTICEKDRNRVVKEFESANESSRNIQLLCAFNIKGDCSEPYVMTATVMRTIDNKTSGFFVNFTSPSRGD